MEGIDANYISSCLYHPEEDPLCPIFRLGDIVKLSGFNFETIAKVVRELQMSFTLDTGWMGMFFRWRGCTCIVLYDVLYDVLMS